MSAARRKLTSEVNLSLMLNLHVVIERLKRKSMLVMLHVFHTVRVTFLHTTVVHPCGPDILRALDCSSRLLTVLGCAIGCGALLLKRI